MPHGCITVGIAHKYSNFNKFTFSENASYQLCVSSGNMMYGSKTIKLATFDKGDTIIIEHNFQNGSLKFKK
jgi:hypothetical protein